jgi:hypothetical protein
MSLLKQGLLVALVLGVALAAWLASRRRRGPAAPATVPDDGFDLIDDLVTGDGAVPPDAAPTQVLPLVNDAALARHTLSEAVDNRPADVAHVLSNWLKPKETSS